MTCVAPKVEAARRPTPERGAARRVALVLGMSETGLSTLRLLGRAGICCYALDAIEPLPAFWSRYCRRSKRLAEGADDETILREILAFAAQMPPRPVLIPTSDRMVQLVSRARNRLETSFEILLPDPDLVEDLLDKNRFAARALAVNAPVPRGGTIDGVANLPDAVARYGLPLILKPVRQNDIAGTNFPKALLLREPEQVTAAMERYASCNGMLLLAQEYVPGDDSQQFSVAVCLDRDSRVLATFTARKRRQGTHGTGVGLYVERMEDPEAEALAVGLLRELKCVGIGEVEIKRHAGTGRLYVIEINLRVWLQVALPAACGLNFPALFHAIAAGQKDLKPSIASTRRRVAWQDLLHDAYATFRPGGYYRKGAISIVGWLMQSLRATSGPYLSVRDPLPAMVWMWHVAGKLIGGILPARQPTHRLAATPTPAGAAPAFPSTPNKH